MYYIIIFLVISSMLFCYIVSPDVFHFSLFLCDGFIIAGFRCVFKSLTFGGVFFAVWSIYGTSL